MRIGANLAVIVSTAPPDSLVEFGRMPHPFPPPHAGQGWEGVDGVWMAGLRAWPALAVA